MRLATWNVNSVLARLPRLLDWLADVAPDVVCLQETKCPAEGFPRAQCEALGYQVAVVGDGRWNGVALLSRVGLVDASVGFPGQPGWVAVTEGEEVLFAAPPAAPIVEARAVGATCGPLRTWSVYVPNGRTLDSPHYGYKLEWLAALRVALAPEVASGAPFALCGDFNVAPTDDDVWDRALFEGSTHVSGAERDALAALRELGLVDVMPRPLKNDRPFTYWDYRAGAFPKDMGMRIDLVYASRPAVESVRDAYVDRNARKGKAPSDHAPVVVDLDL